MKLSDMTEAEKQALAILIRAMVGADGKLSPGEYAGVEEAAAELGEEEFWGLMNEANSGPLIEEEIKAPARAVERKEAQEVIYGTLFSLAAAGSIVDQEASVLDWLADTWGLETQTPAPEEA